MQSELSVTVSHLATNTWLIVIAGVVLFALAALMYYKTNPPLARGWRITFWVLRVLALLTLLVALLQPVVQIERTFERPARIALLLDRSNSMNDPDGKEDRIATTDSILSLDEFAPLESGTDLTRYYFGGNLSRTTVDLDAERTALGEVLRELAEQEIDRPSDAWLVISDGNVNSGVRPSVYARGLDRPVYTLNVARSSGQYDVGIDDIEFNPVQFTGRQASFKVRLKYQQVKDKEVVVRLVDRGTELASPRHRVTIDGGYGEIDLKWTPQEPGRRLLTVKVDPLEGETTVANNERTVEVNVLRSRLRVLLATYAPDYEVGFLNRFLEKSEQFDVDLVVLGRKSGNLRGQLPTIQSELNRYDIVVLYDLAPDDLTAQRNLLGSYLRERGGGIWMILGNRFASAQPQQWLNDLLPFWSSGSQPIWYADNTPIPEEGQLFHPALRLGDDRGQIRRIWSSLAPFKSLVPCDSEHGEAVILLRSNLFDNLGDRWPLLGYRRFGPGKTMLSAGLPLWSWGFGSLAYGGDNGAYDKHVGGILSWLSLSDDFAPVSIAPEQAVFTRGEPVKFNARAFDQGFRPLSEVTGEVSIKAESGTDTYEFDILAAGEPGTYEADGGQLSPGTYSYSATLQQEGQTIKEVTGQFRVEKFSLEEFDRSGDPETLQALARETGGRYFDLQTAGGLPDALPLAAVWDSERSETVYGGQWWILALFVGLLGLEWLLRKLNHLI